MDMVVDKVSTDTDPPGAVPDRPGRRRVVGALCWLLVLPWTGWAVVRLADLDRGLVVQLLAFTPYVAATAPLPLVVTAALRRRWSAGVAAVAAVALVGVVAPRALPDGGPAATGPGLRVLTANLLYGGADPVALVERVRAGRVDVLAVQEFTPQAQEGLDRAGLAGLLPYRQLGPVPGAAGSGLYSRFPVVGGGVRDNGGGFRQAYGTVLVPDAPPVRALPRSDHRTVLAELTLPRV
jgi:hypothetical protein